MRIGSCAMATGTPAGPSGPPTRNVSVLAATIGALSLGEELWQAYLPTYLAALGASGLAVGAFASARELLDSAYQLPGGWITDRVGYRRALLTFTGIAALGYAIYAVAPTWPVMRSEERRVGKECRSRWSPYGEK